jgi:hypothetical protein
MQTYGLYSCRSLVKSIYHDISDNNMCRVLDFSRVLAGPYASQILGDMGKIDFSVAIMNLFLSVSKCLDVSMCTPYYCF